MIRAHTVALVLAAMLGLGTFAAAASPLSYTPEQAAAGRLAYIQDCAECHGGELGGKFGPALAGPNARNQWESPQYVYGYYSVAMPHGHPGQLPQRDYVDIMAYLLQRHNKPAGTRPLTAGAIAADTAPIGN